MDKTRTFDIEKVSVIWNGMVITGYADSDITLSRNADDVTTKTGIKGDVVYSNNADKSGTLKISLFMSSASLATLRMDAQNRVEAPLTVRNANEDSGFIVSHPQCRIIKVPDFAAGKEEKSGEVQMFIPVLSYSA